MIDLNAEYELAHTGYEPRNLRLDDDGNLRVEFWEGEYRAATYTFDPITGVGHRWAGQENPVRLRPKSATRPKDVFHVQAGIRNWAKEDWCKTGIEFPTGGEAAAATKEHNAKAQDTDSPFRFRVQKETILSPVLDYPSWMAFRFMTGEYKPVPWANEPWADRNDYVHISIADEFQVAFVENDEHGEMDHLTTMAPGRYLKRFYGDRLNDTEIRNWAVKVDVESTLKFAKTEDEIYRLYTAEGAPHSCMIYKDDHGHWRSGMNPVRVYAAGDLAFAYLERRGKITARAMVWPEKKAVQRIYGDIERMSSALLAEGWELDCETHNIDSRGKGLFNGAKLQLKEACGTYVMPYLDYGYQATLEDGVLKMDRDGEISCRRTDGLCDAPHCDVDDDDDDDYDTNCDRCGDGLNYDDSYTVNGESNWCYGCQANYSTTCDYCSDRFTQANLTDILDARDGSTHSEACRGCIGDDSSIQRNHAGQWIDTSTAQECEDCSTWFSEDDDASDCPNTSCSVHAAEEVDA